MWEDINRARGLVLSFLLRSHRRKTSLHDAYEFSNDDYPFYGTKTTACTPNIACVPSASESADFANIDPSSMTIIVLSYTYVRERAEVVRAYGVIRCDACTLPSRRQLAKKVSLIVGVLGHGGCARQHPETSPLGPCRELDLWV